jgi:hypothetical protein
MQTINRAQRQGNKANNLDQGCIKQITEVEKAEDKVQAVSFPGSQYQTRNYFNIHKIKSL